RANTSRSEQRPKQAKQGKRFTPTKGKERSTQLDNPKRDKESRVCYECGKPGHLAKDCFSKKKGKGKPSPKKAAVNSTECDNPESETTEVWINSTSVPTNATEPIASYKTQSQGMKPSVALEGRIRIAGREARVLFDTGAIGRDIISATFVSTYGIPTEEMKQPVVVHMVMKGSRSNSQKQCKVDIEIGRIERDPFITI